MNVETIAILDCGGQYTKVIDRKVREMSVKSEIFSVNVSAETLRGFQGIILSGGPASVWSEQALKYDPGIFDLNVPILGICYGMHLINQHFGGKVVPGHTTEYGETAIEIDAECPLFSGLEPKQQVLMSHGDSVVELAGGFKAAATSGHVYAAVYDPKRRIYGVQFHPEVDLTVNGRLIMENFLKKICGLTGNYRLEDRINTAIAKIRDKVKDQKILVLVSGGVDSAVSAALLVKALNPDNVYAIHIDHGLMRKNESDIVCENLRELGLKNLIREDAEQVFFNSVIEVNGQRIGPLTQLVDPEAKRNLIGEVFIRVVKKTAEDLHLDFDKTFWAQGTLRPDLIESGNPDVSSHAHKIKTHHNDVDIVRRARERGLVVETNWDWHKDEVRQVARALGIDESIARRQPFPGPGLAVRIMCNDGTNRVTPDQTDKFTQLMAEMAPGYRGAIAPLKTVGVQGDCRSYRYLAVVAGKDPAKEWDEIYNVGKNLPNRVDFINRVAYVLNPAVLKGDINTYQLYINKENVELLREVDDLVVKALNQEPISQFFAVLLPLGVTKKYSVAIRTFITNDFMTGRPAFIGKEISKELLAEIVAEIGKRTPEIDLILYDVTSKPPATVEWQ
ncbi:MAG: glutamine-hydrolyzing GMP synthase [Bacillota bacterium]